MAGEQHYFRIGLFSVGALLILAVVLLCLGIADDFSERIYFTTTFSDSVQGLSKGSEVKYKGVPVGTVERITILADKKLIRVDMSIDPRVFRGFKNAEDEKIDQLREFFQHEMQNGLCCYLELSGITGQRYVEMDYLPESRRRKKELPAIEVPDDVIFIPSAPGTFNNIINSVADSLDKIADIDIAKLVADLEKNLEVMHEILSDPSIRQMLEKLDNIAGNIENISRNIDETLDEEEMKKIRTNLNENLENLKVLSAEMNTKLQQLDVKGLSEKLEKTLESGQQLMDDLNESRYDVVRTMHHINSLTENINELVDELKRDPSSLLRGKNVRPLNLE